MVLPLVLVGAVVVLSSTAASYVGAKAALSGQGPRQPEKESLKEKIENALIPSLIAALVSIVSAVVCEAFGIPIIARTYQLFSS